MLARPDRDTPGADNVRPGLHPLGAGDDGYGVVWWDPRTLALDVQPLSGLRRRELLEDAGRPVVDADRKRYDEWREERRTAIERGGQPSIAVELVTERARRPPAEVPVAERAVEAEAVEIVTAAAGVRRPSGARFGTLVHGALATVALDASPEAVADAVRLQARILDASPDEEAAARAVVGDALAHALMAGARAAWATGHCRRETPVAGVAEDGVLVEGVLDLAYEDDHGWTVIDFKTDADLAGSIDRYRRQVALYASLVRRVTGRPVRAVLLRV